MRQNEHSHSQQAFIFILKNKLLNMWRNKVLVVDEIEAVEREETYHLLTTLFNLAFVGMLKEQVRLELLKEYRYSTIQPNLNKVTPDIKDVFFYFEEAVAEVDYKEVWETVCDVCHFLDIPLDKSWHHYLPELVNLPMSTVIHPALLELENFPRTLSLGSIIGSIIHHGQFKIHRRHQSYPDVGYRH